MKATPRRLGRLLFGLAGVGSALFVHFLPAPAEIGVASLSGSGPAAVSASSGAERGVPPGPRPSARRARGEEAEPPAPARAVVDDAALPASAPATPVR